VRDGKFQDNSRAQKIRGVGNRIRNAPAQGTLRAWKKMNQIRRTQFRAKSGAVVAADKETAVEEIVFAGVSGNVHVTTAEMRSET